MSKKRRPYRRSKLVYVGFLGGAPHVQVELGARMVQVYTSKATAKRAYRDVRTARLVFDSNWRSELAGQQ